MKTVDAAPEMRRRATAAVRARLYSTKSARTFLGGVWPRALVLAYHRLGEPEFDPFGQAVAPGTFARHLEVLQSNYRVRSLDELLRELRERRVEDGTAVVTFDDGYADVLLAGAPIAAEREVPLHLFVPVQPILEGSRFWWDRLAAALLTEGAGRAEKCRTLQPELKRLPAEERARRLDELLGERGQDEAADLGRAMTPEELLTFTSMPRMSIGAHTLSHPVLGILPAEEQRRELAESRSALQELTGKEVDTVAYPYGKPADLNRDTAHLAAEAGYEAGFTTVAQPLTPRSDRFLLPRLTVHDWPEESFRERLRTIFGY
jgi:peptidoglycan/xylan/chitin deacetylase (PgdA/CDA1 family)